MKDRIRTTREQTILNDAFAFGGLEWGRGNGCKPIAIYIYTYKIPIFSDHA